MFRKIMFLFVACAVGTMAQAQGQVVTAGDKVVKRITFDREQVTLIYEDNTQEPVEQATINRTVPSGISNVKKSAKTSGVRSWYTVDGRKLQKEPARKGIYVRKEGNKVRKTIKK